MTKLILAVSIVFSFLTLLVDQNLDSVLLAVTNLLSVAAPMAILYLFRADRNYSGMQILLLFFFVTGVGRGFYFTLIGSHSTGDWYFTGMQHADFLFSAAWSVAFNIMLAAGYSVSGFAARWRLPRRINPEDMAPPSRLEQWAKLAVIIIALFGATRFLQLTGGFRLFESGKSSTYVDGVKFVYGQYLLLVRPILGVCLLSLIRILQNKNAKLDRFLFIFSFVFIVWWSFIISVRGDILMLLLMMSIVFIVMKGKIPVIRGGIVAAFALMLIAVIIQTRAGQSNGGSIVETAETVFESLFGEFNLGGFVSLAHSIRVVPDILPFEMGSTYLQTFWLFVPRTIWLDKPLAVGALWVPALTPETVARQGGGVATGLIGESFLNFGHLGLVVVPVMFGMLMHMLDRFVYSGRKNAVILTTALLIMNSATYSSYGYYFANGIIEATIAVAPFFILFLLDKKYQRQYATQLAEPGRRQAARPLRKMVLG